MKRLTKRWGANHPEIAGRVVCEFKECESVKPCTLCPHAILAERLASLEDILGEEYSFEELAAVIADHKKRGA